MHWPLFAIAISISSLVEILCGGNSKNYFAHFMVLLVCPTILSPLAIEQHIHFCLIHVLDRLCSHMAHVHITSFL